MQEQDDLLSGAGDRDAALRALLSRSASERSIWDKFKREGASDTQLINHLRAAIPKTGRTGSEHGICCFKLKPEIAFWFGSYAVGEPTFKGRDLLGYVRDVMEIPARNGANLNKPAEVTGSDDESTDLCSLTDSELFELQIRLSKHSGDRGRWEQVVAERHRREKAAETALERADGADSVQLSLFDYSQLDEDDAIVVRAAATEIQQRMASMQFNFVEVGRRLSEVKDRIGRGHFEGWLRAEFGMSRDSAERWIQAAELVNQSPQIAEKVKAKQFSKSAVYLLAAPSTPAGAREEVVSRLEAGQEVSHAATKQIVERHRISEEAETSPAAGSCRVCGCTMTEPCYDNKTGETCAWADESETICTRCSPAETPSLIDVAEQGEAIEPEVVASGRTLDDLLSLLKATPAGMQIEDLIKLDFSPKLIDNLVESRLIDRTVKGICSYSWTAADVAGAIKERGPMGLIDLEQLGCKRYAVEVAKSEGLIEQQGSKWALADETKAKKIAERKAAGPEKKAVAATARQAAPTASSPKIESLLKGRMLVLTFTWMPQLAGRVTVGVRVGTDITQMRSETLEADKMRGFPEPVQRMIVDALKGAQPPGKSARSSASKPAVKKSASAKRRGSSKAKSKKAKPRSSSKTRSKKR